MKNVGNLMAIILFTLFIGVDLQGQVTSDYDKDADFSTYKTFSFAGWVKGSDKILNDLDKTRIQSAFKNEFDRRNLEMVKENSDATITLYIVVDKKTSKTAYTDYVGGMGYAGRWGYGYGGYGMGGSSITTISEDDYLEGTMVIDIYDNETKKLVWQGILKKVIHENPKKREKAIPKNVKKLMKPFPIPPVKK